jgi:transposase
MELRLKKPGILLKKWPVSIKKGGSGKVVFTPPVAILAEPYPRRIGRLDELSKLYYGDNLTVLRNTIDDESVDLIYLDPPFNSQATYNVLFRSTSGEQSQAQIEAFDDTWHWGDEAELAFDGVMSSQNGDAAEMLRSMSGVPFHRLEQLEAHLGIPMPAATQWDIVEEAAELIKPAGDEFIRQAAQGEVLHNDDTSMRVLKLKRPEGDERTGVFTSGIVSTGEGRRIALFFTGRQHAGENIADVMKHRAAELPRPIQMCDALSRNVPRLAAGVEILLALCLAQGRRQFVEVAADFPEECRYVLEMLGQVYGYDAEAREQAMTPVQRLQFHQQRSGPVMERLHRWLELQLAEHKTEPNSGLGKAIRYLLRHWKGLTLFLREAGVLVDNNVVERSLKRVVLHRKNALFYRTLNGAQVGDPYMTLIHTCQLCSVKSFNYLIELQRHARELATNPSAWMPWNYRKTLARAGV